MNFEGKRAIYEIPISEIHMSESYPFRSETGSGLDDLCKSIRDIGVIENVVLRPETGGGYETVTGYRRVMAAEMAGLASVPARIINVSDEEANLITAQCGLAQKEIRPRDRIMATRMMNDSKKKKEYCKNLFEYAEKNIEENEGITKLADLIPEFLEMIDCGEMNLQTGINIAHLSDDEQKLLLAVFRSHHLMPDTESSGKIRSLSEEGKLNLIYMENILRDMEDKTHPVILDAAFLNRYFPKNISDEKVISSIENAIRFFMDSKRKVILQ